MPLDSRADYTKSDWLVWTATLCERKEDFEEFIAPMWLAFNLTPGRVPMTDWYYTITSLDKTEEIGEISRYGVNVIARCIRRAYRKNNIFKSADKTVVNTVYPLKPDNNCPFGSTKILVIFEISEDIDP
jgi:hypothetical protein